MAITERNLKSQKILQLVTDVDDASITSRRRLKGIFLEKDKHQMNSYIKDLEKTILLNKEIISDLIASEKSSAYKKVLDKLNKENSMLQMKVKELIRERDNVQAKLLVSEQLVEEFKRRESDMEQHYVERSHEMLEQLNMKEYVLQSYERRFRKAIALLQKYEERDVSIRFLLRELSEDSNTKKSMTNLVEENEVLVGAVKELLEKLSLFEQELCKLAYGNTDEVNSVELLPRLKKRAVIESKKNSVKKELASIESNSKEMENLVLKMKAEKEMIEKNMNRLTKENISITLMNTKLSQDLYDAKQELLTHNKFAKVRHVVKIPIKRNRKNSEPSVRHSAIEAENFGDVSSIEEDCKEGEFLSFCQDINDDN